MAFSKIVLDGTTLMDVTQDTVAAANLLSGETAHAADGQVVTGTYVPSGGGSTDGDVIFLDYDGTIVTSKTKAEIDAMTSDSDLPTNPTHTGLIAQGWNWTVTQLKAQLTAMPDQKVYVGQMYITESGKTEIDVKMQEGRLSPILTICVNGEISVDWGDETTPDTVTGSSESTRLAVQHSYASAGSYTISISVVSGSFSFYGSTQYTLLRKNTTSNENRVYANCVRQIKIGNGISNISGSAFYYCSSLASITIPSGVTSIGDSVFCNCSSLTSIAIPSGVTSIGNSAFYSCYSLASITIPIGVTSIGNSAFSYCDSLTSIAIPSGVTSIGNSVFQYCYSLASITIPSEITSIGSSMFQYCCSLANLAIPSGVTSIGISAFDNCHSLATITIPSRVTSIEKNTFYNCYSLASITIPSGVTSISEGAFSYCSSLASITISSSATSIGKNTFYNCYSLASITIPSSVASIGNSAFYGCYGMSEYHILPTTVPTLGTSAFTSISSDCVIYVPQGKLNDYQTETNWSSWASKMQEEP